MLWSAALPGTAFCATTKAAHLSVAAAVAPPLRGAPGCRIAFSPLGDQLAVVNSTDADGTVATVSLCRREDWAEQQVQLVGHENTVVCAAWSPKLFQRPGSDDAAVRSLLCVPSYRQTQARLHSEDAALLSLYLTATSTPACYLHTSLLAPHRASQQSHRGSARDAKFGWSVLCLQVLRALRFCTQSPWHAAIPRGGLARQELQRVATGDVEATAGGAQGLCRRRGGRLLGARRPLTRRRQRGWHGHVRSLH